MPLEIPAFPAGWSKPTVPQGRRFRIELITPLFGGGVEPGVNDESFPFRPTSIRGQLQFWWRATAGARCDSKEDLRKRQSEVWGDTERASPVEVRVVGWQASSPKPCAEFEPDRRDAKRYRSMPKWDESAFPGSLSYALFPFQGQLADERRKIEKQPASCIHQASFQLEVRCPDKLWPEVEEAIRAWILFGGLGSRTRRGCGAIRCQEFDLKDRGQLTSVLQAFLRDPSPGRKWPTLAGAILVGPENGKAVEAWKAAVELLRDFRQRPGIGRNKGNQPNRPGRSRWPEPDTIRRITGQWLGRHKPDDKMPNGFPRAELGLPIVFHFKDRDDPPDTVLYPGPAEDGIKRDRMASPLILKATALGNGNFVPLIVLFKMRFDAPFLTSVDLRQGERSLSLEKPPLIRDPRLSVYANSPLNGRSRYGSALEAFLRYAVSQGFVEIQA